MCLVLSAQHLRCRPWRLCPSRHRHGRFQICQPIYGTEVRHFPSPRQPRNPRRHRGNRRSNLWNPRRLLQQTRPSPPASGTKMSWCRGKRTRRVFQASKCRISVPTGRFGNYLQHESQARESRNWRTRTALVLRERSQAGGKWRLGSTLMA